ncbi:MAG TPA: nicotinate-nucleotide adenylyltransferase [Stellaceae bacterium]|nr:nicotinate-nucleotide adenylyltransferase [Stellaceae bacterium]
MASRARRRIGLLGGSFNPAHRGHLHISLEALKRLDLAEVWWLVAPQNPLKPVKGMASFETRLASARALVRHPRIAVTDLEARLGTRYTADTLAELRRRFPNSHFVWLMGADNLAQIRHWERWQDVFRLAAVAVFDRPTYCLRALAGLAAQRFKRRRKPPRDARRLADAKLPAWGLFRIRLDASSATALRARKSRATTTTR